MICHSINYDDELVIDMHVITSNFLNSMKQDHQVTQKRNFTQAVNTRKTRPLYQQMEAAKEALECFRNGFSIGYAISSEGRINGVMSYTIDSYPDRPIVMTIWCLTKAPWQITHPSKFGIGTRLINKAIFEAKKNSVKKIEVLSFNELSTSFFLKHNFVFQSSSKFINTQKPQVMELNLEE